MSAATMDHRIVQRFRLALVDATLRDELPSHWQQLVIAPSFLGEDTRRCPAVVDLSNLRDDEVGPWCDLLQAQLLDRAETQASLLLASHLSADKVAAHLGRRIALEVAGAEQPMQWRFFDPGTFLQLPRLIGDHGLAWLLGPIDAVYVPWAGEWVLVEQPAKSMHSDASRFRMDSGHLAALMRVGVVNRVLMQGEPVVDAPAWVEQSRRIDAFVLQGQEHGLKHRDDLVAYVQHAQQWNQFIHRHPRLQSLLRQVQQARPEDELDYRGLTALFSTEEWTQMTVDVQTEMVRHKQLTQEAPHP